MAGQLHPEVRGFDDDNERAKYCHRGLEALASNNPLCLYRPTNWQVSTPRKVIFPLKEDAFARIYESDIHPAILHILENLGVMVHFRELHPIGTAFDAEDSRHSIPTVLLFIFEHNFISVKTAKQIVSAVAAKVDALWSGKQVNVDICQRVSQDQRKADEGGEDLIEKYKFVYDDSHPLPGSSIGALENKNCTGTLCGYIAHNGDVFALTNHHVVNGVNREILQSDKPYRYVPGQKKHFVVSPSNADHEQTIAKLKRNRSYVQVMTSKQAAPEAKQRAIEALDASILQAENYDRDLGYIFATSGNVQPVANEHRQDWAIALCGSRSGGVFQNKHRRVDINDLSVDIDGAERQFAIFKYDVEEQWLYQAATMFSTSAVFGGVGIPLIQDEPHYIKPPSARSGSRLGVCNGIQSTLYNGPCGLTREWTFISPKAGRKVTELGDSGSPLLDKDYNIAALLWGGDEYSGVGDLTFGTPFSTVLQDIETRMGWEQGSCTWLK